MENLTAADISRLTRDIYKEGSWARRLMVYGRPYICPFEELVARVPQGSTILDIGCGDGLFLHILGQIGRISEGLGFDNNSAAVATARSAKNDGNRSGRIQFREWSIGNDWPKGEFDVVSMIDVLHHIPPRQKRSAIEEAVRHVKPGGLFIFKDIGQKPRWRKFFNSVHDFVLTGERVTYASSDTVSSWLVCSGMRELERKTIYRVWYGHELMLFSR
jgi:2-polyprenyl-3-methyl-5-hydroxy-6-metoxy-1,4-benzoquinol methylase